MDIQGWTPTRNPERSLLLFEERAMVSGSQNVTTHCDMWYASALEMLLPSQKKKANGVANLLAEEIFTRLENARNHEFQARKSQERRVRISKWRERRNK